MNNAPKLFWISLLVAIVASGTALFILAKDRETAPGALDSFAQCLAEKKITMYGAAWCPHCKNEKKAFGTSWKYVPYVECPDNINLCLEKGIRGYPTWILGDGTKFEGEQGLQKLSEISSCPLPKGE